MNDREFLIWLRERLINVYHESPNVDFVHKLTAIINATPVDKLTGNMGEPLYKLCDGCGCPIKPGRHKPNEYDHAQGCPRDRSKKATGKRRPNSAMDRLMAEMMRMVDETEKRMTPAEFARACREVRKIAERIRKRVSKSGNPKR